MFKFYAGPNLFKGNMMKEPIKVGDMCAVIDGALGEKSPNVGRIVTVRALKGEHSVFGRIWQCEGVRLVTEYGATGMFADFAACWLKKIEPPKTPDKVKEKDLETID